MNNTPRIFDESQIKKLIKPIHLIISFNVTKLEYLARENADTFYWTHSRDCALEFEKEPDVTKILDSGVVEPWRMVSLIKGHFVIDAAYDLNAFYKSLALHEVEEIDTQIAALQQQREILLNR